MKILKKITAIIMVLVMSLSLSGCNEEKKAEEALNQTMSALQKGDFLKAGGYIADTSALTGNAAFDTYKDNNDFTGAIFSKLTYSVNSVEKTDSSNVKINATVSNVNMGNVISNAIGEIFTLALSNAFAPEEEQMSDEQMQNKMAELIAEGINAEDAEIVSKTVDVNVIKTDDGWKIDADEEVVDAVTGGLLTVAENMENSLSE